MGSDSAECIVIDCSSDEDDISIQHIDIAERSVVDTKPKNLVSGQASHGATSDQSIIVDITTPVKRQSQQQPRPQDMSPQELLELRRKKIDQQLDLFERCQQRLRSIVHLMNPMQRQRWNNNMSDTRSGEPLPNAQAAQREGADPDSDSQVPSSSTSQQPPGARPAWRRPPWFIDPPNPVAFGGSSTTSQARRTAAPPEPDDDENSFLETAMRPYTRRPRTKFKRKRKATSTRRKGAASSGSTIRKVRKTTATRSSAASSTPRASTSSADRKPKKSNLQSMLSKVKVKREH